MKSLTHQSFISLVLFAAIGLLFWGWTSRMMQQEHRRMITDLQQTATWLVERAHRRSDDLLIQETLQALGSTKGITSAVIVNSDQRVLAHSEPTKLGKPFRMTRSGVYSWDLRDNDKSWGRAYLAIAEKEFRRARRRWGFLLMGGMGFLWVLWLKMARAGAGDQAQLRADAATLSLLVKEAEERRQEVQRAAGNEQKRYQRWLQFSIDQGNELVLFLDANQLILAAHSSFQSLIGRAWNEVELLQGLGRELEESLTRPGQTVWGKAKGRDLTFITLPEGGTWVSVI